MGETLATILLLALLGFPAWIGLGTIGVLALQELPWPRRRARQAFLDSPQYWETIAALERTIAALDAGQGKGEE